MLIEQKQTDWRLSPLTMMDGVSVINWIALWYRFTSSPVIISTAQAAAVQHLCRDDNHQLMQRKALLLLLVVVINMRTI